MNFISQNIKYLRERNNLSQEAFGKLFGLTRGQVASYEKEENPSEPVIATVLAICERFQLRADDFLCSNLWEGIPSSSLNDKDSNRVYVLDSKAMAGFTAEQAPQEFWHSLPSFTMPMRELGNGQYVSVQVDGDSMWPTFQHGDWVIARQVEDFMQLKTNEHYLIVLESGLLLKRLKSLSMPSKNLVLASDNKLYPEQTVSHKEVLQIWKIQAKISFHFQDLDAEQKTYKQPVTYGYLNEDPELQKIKDQMSFLVKEIGQLKKKLKP